MLLGAEQVAAEASISKQVAKLSKREVFGVVDDSEWKDVLCKYLINDMFNCSGGSSLDDCEISCLKSKLAHGLTNNCC